MNVDIYMLTKAFKQIKDELTKEKNAFVVLIKN